MSSSNQGNSDDSRPGRQRSQALSDAPTSAKPERADVVMGAVAGDRASVIRSFELGWLLGDIVRGRHQAGPLGDSENEANLGHRYEVLRLRSLLQQLSVPAEVADSQFV